MAAAERKIQTAIKDELNKHPAVSWCFVTTTGLFKTLYGAKIWIGKEDMADIIGQMSTGELLAIEVKVPGKEPTKGQYEFLDMVVKDGGVGFWADSVDSAMSVIDSWANNPK